MKFLDYLKDKVLFLVWNLIVYIIIAFIMYLFNIKAIIIFFTSVIWFLPLLSYIFIEGIKAKVYFGNIEKSLNSIDKKYLFPEVVRVPDYYEGKIIDRILKEISRDMHENVKSYRDKQADYREYIETWVHEIKTPIASLNLIIENNKNEVMEKVDVQTSKLEFLVDQVLYYARSSDVSKDYVIKEINLLDVTQQVIKKNYRDFIGKKISVKIEDIESTVYSDSKWLEFIINQIVVNSLKYSKKEGAFVKFYITKGYNKITLIIEDNGVGIDDKDINRIFEKGFTGENGRIFGKSTGIGLYLCKKLCSKLGIEIKIDSKLNEGTKAYLIFNNI